MSNSSLGLHPAFEETLKQSGFLQFTPIQEKAIPVVLEGKDVLGIARTGSGKTASFVLPILQQIQSIEKPKNRHIHALILVPTRELAIQVHAVIEQFNVNLDRKIKTLPVFGGVSVNPQMIQLQGVEIVVATPGRLIELVESKALSLGSTQWLVLDEADKLLNLGFQDEMKRILDWLPKKRQNLLFSATLSPEIDAIQALVLRNPVLIEIETQEEDALQIELTAYRISDEKKGPLLRYIIRENKLEQVLIFTSSVQKADAVAEKLSKNGIEAKSIHSKKSQHARNHALTQFKAGKITALVATDLIARGIDILDLPVVINYELPRSPKDFVHRIGRTGRAAAQGEAISLITPEDEHHFKIIQKKMKRFATWIDAAGFNLHGY